MENMGAELQIDPTLYLKVSDQTVQNFFTNDDDVSFFMQIFCILPGLAGTIYFLVDFQRPKEARFPAFHL